MFKLVDLLDAADGFPSRYLVVCKRAGLVRAIIINPEILLYDELTSGLDPVTSRRIDKLIMRTNREQKARRISYACLIMLNGHCNT